MPFIYKTINVSSSYSADGRLVIKNKREIDWRTMVYNCVKKGLIKTRKTDHRYNEYNIRIIECQGVKCDVDVEGMLNQSMNLKDFELIDGNGPEYSRMKDFIIKNCN